MSAGTEKQLDERALAKNQLDYAEDQLQSLCASHAGTFVSVQRRGQALESNLKELLESVKEVESQVENAQQSLEQEEEKEDSLAALSERHRVRRRTLLQHSSLLELLELPSLMDACVRSNLYEEALSIAGFANTLERRHTEKNVVVARVISQIRSRQADLRRHLLFRLKNHVTMPQCLEVVTALRRLNSIDLESTGEENLDRVHKSMELRLQIDFLEARDAWLESSSAAAANPRSKVPVGTSEQLLDTIERYRTRMFEVATQYNAIFRAQTNAPDGSASLLSMWISRRVHTFLYMLSGQLSRMEDAAVLRDALEASVFFSTSMGRLGADFTAQLPQLFEPKMLSLVEHAWKEGPQQLEETLKICREAGIAAPLISHNVPPDAASSAPTTEGQPMPPPRSLMALPPLARVVNAILNGLNDLRRCLLPGIFSQLRASLEQLIANVRGILIANEKAVNAPGLRGEKKELREAAADMRSLFSNIVEPYLRGSLEMALGSFEAAEQHYQELRKVEEQEKKQAEEALQAEAQAEAEEQAEAASASVEAGPAAEGQEGEPGDASEEQATETGAAPTSTTEGEAEPAAEIDAEPDLADEAEGWGDDDPFKDGD